jgi:AmmeMemoRadiSam system protein B/AmmeMemoRadiSam system protein A
MPVLVFALVAWLCAAVPVSAGEPRTVKVAGQFYPDEAAELREVVQYYLDRQPEPVLDQKPRALVVPHAGYQYSGVVAANAYRQLQGHQYDGVVVVGFMHRLPFPGSSVETRQSCLTPLGELPVHQEAVAVLQAAGIGHWEPAHEADEHSLEVQLPFLQVALGRFRVVPVLMGDPGLGEARRLAEALALLAKLGDYLFVFSTDLSHYHPYEEAERLDEGTIEAILSETPQAVAKLFDAGRLEACGRGPIIASLALAQRLGYPKRRLLYYANSGDTTGNPARVVGYAAIGMFDRPQATAGRISREAGQALVRAARASLERSVGRSADPPMPPLDQHPELSQARGLFVTLRKDGRLRGCIGRIQTSEPLRQSIAPVAADSALRDHRFEPVDAVELPEIHVEVSVLTPPTALARIEDLVPGRDGVVLEHQGRSGVFLPQVWDETDWTREEFLGQLASQKAGLPPDAWRRARLYVFQDQIFEE